MSVTEIPVSVKPANENVQGRSPRALFGRRPVKLELSPPLPMLTAWLLTKAGSVVGIRCGDMVLRDAHPVYQLCRVLKSSGWQDCAMQVRNHDRSPACFLPSIYFVADFCVTNLAEAWRSA